MGTRDFAFCTRGYKIIEGYFYFLTKFNPLMYWLPSKSGEFNVKAAYKFILDLSRSNDNHIPPVAPPQIWKIVWKLRVPPRIIHFIWRCVYGALPFADTLARRGVTIDDSCPFCEDGTSSACHLFYGCPFALDVLRQAGMEGDVAAATSQTSQQRFCELLSSQSLNIDLFCIICYMIWYYRNRAVFEGVRIDEKLIFSSSATILTDYINSNAWPEKFPICLGSKQWKRPPSRGLHIYFDGATTSRMAGGTGIFISDETGRFIHGASKYYPRVDSPLAVELLVLRDALRLASQLQLHSFSLLGDSQETILAANGEMEVPVTYASVLEEINTFLLSLAYLGIHWIRRSENIVAHELAFFAKTNIDCNESWPSIPEDLLSISIG